MKLFALLSALFLATAAQAAPTIALDACGDVCVGAWVYCNVEDECASAAFTVEFPPEVSVVSVSLGESLDPALFTYISVLRPDEGKVRVVVAPRNLPIPTFPLDAMVAEICFAATLTCTPLAFSLNTFGYTGRVIDIGNADGLNITDIVIVEGGGVSKHAYEPQYPCGDFNGDGLVNTVDASLIQRYSVGTIPYGQKCDVNGDGECSAIDARLIQRHAVGEIAKEDLTCAD